MGQHKDMALRQTIISEYRQGVTYTEISVRYGVSFNTVRTLCRRFKSQGEPGLVPRYANCGRRVKPQDELAFRFVRLIKHCHPLWGVAYIIERIKQGYPSLPLQSERHYQRRLDQSKGKVPKPKLPPKDRVDSARIPHQTWQVDAKECLVLPDGTEACYLNVTDEKTAAVLKAKVFPLGEDMQGTYSPNPEIFD